MADLPTNDLASDLALVMNLGLQGSAGNKLSKDDQTQAALAALRIAAGLITDIRRIADGIERLSGCCDAQSGRVGVNVQS